MILMVGLPGVGKTTLAKHLSNLMEDVAVYESDRIRKRLLGFPPYVRLPSHAYAPDINESVFAHIRKEVCANLEMGRDVIVDATFLKVKYRSPFRDLAHDLRAVPLAVHVFAPEEVVRERLSNDGRVSDATFDVYLNLKADAQLPPEEMTYVSVDGTLDPHINAIFVWTWIKGILRAF